MGLFSFFRRTDDSSAKLAKDRLQVLIAHERSDRDGPDYLPQLKQDILDVIKKYVKVGDESLTVQLETQADCDILELNITLPETRRSSPCPRPPPRPGAARPSGGACRWKVASPDAPVDERLPAVRHRPIRTAAVRAANRGLRSRHDRDATTPASRSSGDGATASTLFERSSSRGRATQCCKKTTFGPDEGILRPVGGAAESLTYTPRRVAPAPLSRSCENAIACCIIQTR